MMYILIIVAVIRNIYVEPKSILTFRPAHLPEKMLEITPAKVKEGGYSTELTYL